ncbi:STAS domain-containing protein [Candidatus Uabimicrobium sp. HlEnr_7]|uniref:STAS domain-containing protein n=1 Tax=Candidatus Uabimicrobium helgolandensis TaxID=3095367 RepID=UPI003556846F
MKRILLDCSKYQLSNGYSVCIIEILGGVDSSNDYTLYRRMAEMINEGMMFFLLDFSKVAYIDSTRLGFLIKLIDDGIKIKFVGFSERYFDLLEMLGLTQLFKCYKDKEDALSAFLRDGEFLESKKIKKIDLALLDKHRKLWEQQRKKENIVGIVVVVTMFLLFILYAIASSS